MSDVLLLEIDLSSHRSIGLFILAIDLQHNRPSEIILTWNLRNLRICMTTVLKFQQTTYTSSRSRKRNIGYRVVVFVFLGLHKMQCACVTLCRDVDKKLIIWEGMPEPALNIPRWPLDQSEYSVWSSKSGLPF